MNSWKSGKIELLIADRRPPETRPPLLLSAAGFLPTDTPFVHQIAFRKSLQTQIVFHY
jgi:hypothetical protein